MVSANSRSAVMIGVVGIVVGCGLASGSPAPRATVCAGHPSAGLAANLPPDEAPTDGGSVTLPAADNEFDPLHEGRAIADFVVESVYENENETRIGARFRHEGSGFVLDVLRIQSLPQAFVWVNTPPPTDQGEPHTLEHLLLGKGTKGRFVASLEDMSLGESSAYTEQWRTCYHFHTAAGADVFFHLLEEKLDAMLHPNYSDEEIRREVCNMGITELEDGTLGLEEKGTVYNEMVSTYERPWGYLWDQIPRLLYGPTHPMAVSSGGEPAAIRDLTPEEIRDFHSNTHHLSNMGAVVSIGDDLSLQDCLSRMSATFSRIEPDAKPGPDPADLVDRLPPPEPAPRGTIAHVHFPHQNPSEPGVLIMVWPAERNLDVSQSYLAGLFVSALASGETSNLYRKFIDSQTRVLDLGSNEVFGWYDSEMGQPVYVGFSNVDPKKATDEMAARVRSLVLEEIRTIASLPAGSTELATFNARVHNLLLEQRRESRNLLNSPPRFGYRGTGSEWIQQVQLLRHEGFRRNLALVEQSERAEALLGESGNPWTELIESWRLLEEPYVVMTTPDAGMLTQSEEARRERIADYTQSLRERFGVASDAEALAKYKEEYDRQTVEIDETARTVELPGFLDNPPLTLDDPLEYHVTDLPGGGDLVVSTFDNMTSSHLGLAFSLYGMPEEMLVYVPALSTILRAIGVIADGRPLAYDEFEEMLRQEVSSLEVSTTSDPLSGRVELLVSGSGTTLAETERAVHWMETILFHPDLRKENLPRIADAVESALGDQRNRMRGSEESWVQDASGAYEHQDRPLYLAAESFLTGAHSLHRLRWMLMEADDEALREFSSLAEEMARRPENASRDRLEGLLDAMAQATNPDSATGSAPAGVPPVNALSPEARALLYEATTDLQKTLGEVPDESLVSDVAYLWRQMASDLAIEPETTLEELRSLLGFIRRQDMVRGYLVASTADTDHLTPIVGGLVGKLDSAPSAKQSYRSEPLVDRRMMERTGDQDPPTFAGLVNESTRAGVHLHTANCANYRQYDDESLLRFLAARLYGGGGAHSMFMQTWSAGLAYSNGLRSDERSGRIIYYAERCPDLTQTMQFVVDVLKRAPEDRALADYAVAQAFAGVRAGARYEQRGASMAADLADGISPQKVAGFRKAILELSQSPNFYEELRGRMLDVYSTVVPGLVANSKARSTSDPSHFVIGPEKQMQSWEAYLQNVETGARLARLYPRDFWQVGTSREG